MSQGPTQKNNHPPKKLKQFYVACEQNIHGWNSSMNNSNFSYYEFTISKLVLFPCVKRYLLDSEKAKTLSKKTPNGFCGPKIETCKTKKIKSNKLNKQIVCSYVHIQTSMDENHPWKLHQGIIMWTIIIRWAQAI